MKISRDFVEAGAASVVLTLLSGLASSTIIGASSFGWPNVWIRKLVIAPIYNPWVVDWYGVIIDLVFWFVLSWLVIYVLKNLSGSKPAKRSKASMK